MEKDPEIKGEGNSYTTEFRQYDPRLGRWLSLDPLMSMFPDMSPYVAFDNNPIYYTDPLGLAAQSEGDPPTKTIVNGTALPENANNGDKVDVRFEEQGYTSHYMYSSALNKWECVGRDFDETAIVAQAQPSTGWTRVWGGVKVAMGAVEASIGAAMIASGVGAPIGALFFLHGADVAASGANQMISGQEEKTFTYQGIKSVAKSAGASEETANNVAEVGDGAISIASAGGAGALQNAKPVLAVETYSNVEAQVTTTTENVVSNGLCFIAGTLIAKESDFESIENIKIGDLVWSYDDISGKIDLKEVTNVFVRSTDLLYKLVLENDTIYTTKEHPFYRNGQWIIAEKLESGDSLRLLNGKNTRLIEKFKIDTNITVYNFTVKDFHTYYVGKQCVLVHNNGGCGVTGALTDNFIPGVQLEGSYNLSNGYADFTIGWIKNVSGIRGHGLSSFTTKAELMASESKINQVRIIFQECVNKDLRAGKYAAKYGYKAEFINNGTGAGTVIWTKTLK
jgi:RHS repeat-associated protein